MTSDNHGHHEAEAAELSQAGGRIGASVSMAEASLAEVLSRAPDDALWLAAKLRIDADDLQRRGFPIRAGRVERAAKMIEVLAIATEARRATTVQQGVVHEGADPKGIAQKEWP